MTANTTIFIEMWPVFIRNPAITVSISIPLIGTHLRYRLTAFSLGAQLLYWHTSQAQQHQHKKNKNNTGSNEQNQRKKPYKSLDSRPFISAPIESNRAQTKNKMRTSVHDSHTAAPIQPIISLYCRSLDGHFLPVPKRARFTNIFYCLAGQPM